MKRKTYLLIALLLATHFYTKAQVQLHKKTAFTGSLNADYEKRITQGYYQNGTSLPEYKTTRMYVELNTGVGYFFIKNLYTGLGVAAYYDYTKDYVEPNPYFPNVFTYYGLLSAFDIKYFIPIYKKWYINLGVSPYIVFSNEHNGWLNPNTSFSYKSYVHLNESIGVAYFLNSQLGLEIGIEHSSQKSTTTTSYYYYPLLKTIILLK